MASLDPPFPPKRLQEASTAAKASAPAARAPTAKDRNLAGAGRADFMRFSSVDRNRAMGPAPLGRADGGGTLR